MGCAGSKRVEAAVSADVYLPPPTSIAVFDINTIDEPWLITTTTQALQDKKPTYNVPLPILEKLDKFEVTPQSWSEISNVLEDLKPSFHDPDAKIQPITAVHHSQKKRPPPPPSPQKNHSFNTLEELDAQLSPNKKTVQKKESPPSPTRLPSTVSLPEGLRPVSQNRFILRDKQEREKMNDPADACRRRRRDPLEGFPEMFPPGGAEGVVLYTTTLRGVRRTFDDCDRVRQLVEGHGLAVAVDERDVSLHGEYLKELRELLGEGASVPRLFVKGRYIGGAEEAVELNETGRLGAMLRLVVRGRGADVTARKGCEGCGGARFVPCFECSGSCKVVLGGVDGKQTVRCGRCNENGLVQCPLCR